MTKIITFTNSGLYALPHDDIEVMPCTIIVNKIEEYLEGIEIKSVELCQREKVSKIDSVDVMYPNLNDISKLLDSLILAGADSFLFIVGAIDGIDIAPKIEILKLQYPNTRIDIVNSDSVGYITSYLALEARRLLDTLPIDEILSELETIKYNSNIYYLEEARGNDFNIYKIENSKIIKQNKKMKLEEFEAFIKNEISDDTITPFILHFDEYDSFLSTLDKLAYFKRAKRYYMAPSVRYYFKNKTYGFGYVSKLNKSM